MTLDSFVLADIANSGASRARVESAITIYGINVVSAALSSVALCDPDAAHTAFSNMEMEEHADCIAHIFFEADHDAAEFDDRGDYSGDLGPTGHGDMCYSDADDGL